MTHSIQKTDTRLGFGRDRLIIKSFASADAMHRFLNAQYDNAWQETHSSHADKKAGTYAFAGGKWHNVRKLDAMSLAHI